jgi:hypothetical protein
MLEQKKCLSCASGKRRLGPAQPIVFTDKGPGLCGPTFFINNNQCDPSRLIRQKKTPPKRGQNHLAKDRFHFTSCKPASIGSRCKHDGSRDLRTLPDPRPRVPVPRRRRVARLGRHTPVEVAMPARTTNRRRRAWCRPCLIERRSRHCLNSSNTKNADSDKQSEGKILVTRSS